MQQNNDVSLLGRISLALSTPAMKLAPFMLVLIIAATAFLVKPAMTIQNDDDVIKFLPQDDEKIVKFKDVSDKFHGLQMAIVGVEANDDGNLFNLEDITLIRRYATEFKTLQCKKIDKEGDYILDAHGEYVMTPCVSNTTCFTEIQDIGHGVTENGEITSSVTDLVPELPAPGSQAAIDKADEIAETLKTVYDHSRTLDHVNGFLVSDDGKAAAVYAQVDDANVVVKDAADAIKEHIIKVQNEMGLQDKVNIYYGGSPFIGSYSADTARGDMYRLMPWVALIVIGIILLTSKSIFATLIALFSVGVSIVWVMGGMNLFGCKLTLISTSLPILLLALGSAYSIHLLNSMLSNLDSGMTRQEAMKEALIHTGPPIIVCVATTAAGFFSFCAMDTDPMVEYGAAMGISTIVIMFVTFWVVTSACVLLPIKPQQEGRAPKWAINAMKKGSEAVYRNGVIASIVVVCLFAVGGFFASKVNPSGGNSSYFAEGSEPMISDDFMVKNFGGANFIQTEINGDVSSPLVLRQVERMTAYIKAHPRIAGIQSISDVVFLVGGSMGDGTHITDNPLQAKNLTALAFSNDASVAMELAMCACEVPTRNGVCLPECVSPTDGSCLQTCSPDMNWHHSLMQIRVKDKDLSEGAQIARDLQKQMEPIFSARVAIPRDKMNENAIAIEKNEVIQHIHWILQAYMLRNNPATGKQFVEKDIEDKAIEDAIWNTKVTVEAADLRGPINMMLFDEEDASVYLDYEREENTPTLDGITNIIHTAMMEGKYTEEFLFDLIKANADPEELEDEAGMRRAVTYIYNALNNVSEAKLRDARAAAIFKAANVSDPSERFDELVKSAVWGLADDNAFLPRDKVTDLLQYNVEFHSEQIAADINEAIESAESITKESVNDLLGSKLFDVARIYYFDKEKLNRDTLANAIVDAIKNNTYSVKWLEDELHKAMHVGEEIEVIPSGYPIIYEAMTDSVVHNQVVSLVYSFVMVLICLIFFSMSLHMGVISIIPAMITVILTFGVMGVFGLGLDVGSSMIAAISLSVGIDYACHLIWKFGRPAKTQEACKIASDHMIETTGWGVVINALEIGLGLSVLYFGDLLPMRNFGVLTGVAMIISAVASLLLLSGLMRWARMHSSRQDVLGADSAVLEGAPENMSAAPASVLLPSDEPESSDKPESSDEPESNN